MATGCSWRRRACRAATLTSARTCAIRDVVAPGDLPGASTETRGLFAHVLPPAVLNRPREGMVPDITAPTRAGQRAPAAGAPPPPKQNVMMDVKTLSGAAELSHSRILRHIRG